MCDGKNIFEVVLKCDVRSDGKDEFWSEKEFDIEKRTAQSVMSTILSAFRKDAKALSVDIGKVETIWRLSRSGNTATIKLIASCTGINEIRENIFGDNVRVLEESFIAHMDVALNLVRKSAELSASGIAHGISSIHESCDEAEVIFDTNTFAVRIANELFTKTKSAKVRNLDFRILGNDPKPVDLGVAGRVVVLNSTSKPCEYTGTITSVDDISLEMMLRPCPTNKKTINIAFGFDFRDKLLDCQLNKHIVKIVVKWPTSSIRADKAVGATASLVDIDVIQYSLINNSC